MYESSVSMSRHSLSKGLHTSRWIRYSPCPVPHTLLPFLYETNTIRTFSKSTQRPLAHKRSHVRDTGSQDGLLQGDHIPFDNVQQRGKGAAKPARVEKDDSSLSATEREAFTKLFEKLGSPDTTTLPSTRDKSTQKQRQRGDTTPLQGLSSEQATQALSRLPPSIRSLAQTALERVSNSRDESSRPVRSGFADIEGEMLTEATEEAAEAADDALESHIERLEALFNKQQTDISIWEVLCQELFEPLKLLNLDGKQQVKTTGSNNTPVKATSTANPELVLASIPHVTLLATEHLQERYPASTISLSILPQLKRISRTAHTLALSPDLYASILLIDWSRSSSPASTISNLQEMETEGVEFDRAVLSSLAHIMREGQAMRSGAHGDAVRLICSMEGWEDKLAELRKVWAPRVKQRIVDAAVKEAHAREEQLLHAPAPPDAEGEVSNERAA